MKIYFLLILYCVSSLCISRRRGAENAIVSISGVAFVTIGVRLVYGRAYDRSEQLHVFLMQNCGACTDHGALRR